jgi:hypothetical protein
VEKNFFEGSVEGGLTKVANEFGGQSPRGAVTEPAAVYVPDGPSALSCFLPSFLNDKKTTSPTNEMDIRT